MKKSLLFLFVLGIYAGIANAQIINPGFETWTNDIVVPSAMNPNSGNNTFGWWDYNLFNSSLVGSSPLSVFRCTDTVHSGVYSLRLESKVYTATSWNIYKTWGYPFIYHEYNDTLGILFDGKVNISTQSYVPGIPCTQSLTQFKFYYQYQPNGNDTAECRVELLSNGTPVAGGAIKMNATGNMGWQEATIDFAYINGYTPDTLYILFSSTSLDYAAHENSKLWLDDVSVTLPSGIEQKLNKDDEPLVSPNPSNGIFSVQYPGNGPQTVTIYNVVGKKIYSTTKNIQTTSAIDISQFPNGVYFLKLTNNKGTKVTKIVKE